MGIRAWRIRRVTSGALDTAISTLEQNSGLTAVAGNALDAASIYNDFFAIGGSGGPTSNTPPDSTALEATPATTRSPDLTNVGAGTLSNDASLGTQISGGDGSTPSAITSDGSGIGGIGVVEDGPGNIENGAGKVDDAGSDYADEGGDFGDAGSGGEEGPLLM